MTDPECFLGVDGGGTKTRFALLDSQGRVLAEAERGTTYHPQVGLEGVRAILASGVEQVLGEAGLSAAAIRFAFFGLPAYGEDRQATSRLHAIPAAVLGHERYACDNDMVCGWAGSLAGEDGINVISGTGSMTYGERAGVGRRVGGWGELFGDEGSAYWIAMQGLNIYSRMSDGRLPKGALHALINEKLGLGDDLDLCAHVYGANAKTRGELAQFCPLIARAAESGDEAACGIFHRAGQELALIAGALRRKLGYEHNETVKLSYSGGAFAAGELLLAPFRQSLDGTGAYTFCRPLHEPHIGAALYAAKLWKNRDS